MINSVSQNCNFILTATAKDGVVPVLQRKRSRTEPSMYLRVCITRSAHSPTIIFVALALMLAKLLHCPIDLKDDVKVGRTTVVREFP